MPNTYPVIVTYGEQSVRYSTEFQTEGEFGQKWKRVLESAHGKASVTCTCPGKGKKRLAIRHYPDGDTFGLARFPLSGAEHAKECRFYSPNPEMSGRGSYSIGVLEERPDGTMKVRLGIGLSKRDPATTPTPPDDSPPRTGGPRRVQPAMKLLGLLHLLWSEADLNVWWPAMAKKRNVGRVHWWLHCAAKEIIAGKHDLDQVLLLAAGSEGSSDEKRNVDKVRAALKAKNRMLVIAPLAAYTPEREVGITSRLPIAGYFGIPPMFMTQAIWLSVERRFPNAAAAWRDGHRVVAIAQIDPRQGSSGPVSNVVDVALMAVTQEWIPVESSYERVIAEKLVAEGRGFNKPLRFEAGEDAVHPDFILLDAPALTPLEVFGRADENYLARAAEKTAYYKEHFGVDGWWSWNAAADPAGKFIPAFPPRREAAAAP